MDPIIHPSAPDVLLWLGTVTKLKGESNVMQWYVDLTNVVPIIDRDIWDIMNGTYGIPDGGPVQEHDADEIIAGACAQYGKKKEEITPQMMEDWERWYVTKPRERYRRWSRNREIARHALNLTIHPSLRHLIDQIPLPCRAFDVLMKEFSGGFPPGYFEPDYFDQF